MRFTGKRSSLCYAWLMRHDSEAREFWRSLPANSDFESAVIDNLNQYGEDETGQADFALEAPR